MLPPPPTRCTAAAPSVRQDFRDTKRERRGHTVTFKNIQINPRTGDITGALLFIAAGIVAFVISLDFQPPVLPGDPGAAFFPRLIVSVMLLFGIILVVQRLRAREPDNGDATASVAIDLSSFSVTVASVLGLILVMDYVGFEVAAVAFLFILLGWRTGRWVWALITSVVAMLIMYVTFVALLKVQLPMLFLPKYIYF